MSENRVIGKGGKLPWHLPHDLTHFKKLTMGKNILMGRKTFDSIGSALKNRNNFVLTRNQEFYAPNVRVFHRKDEVLESGLDEIMVIGGEDIYRLFLKECTRIYLTLVHTTIVGDAYFPQIHGFKELSREDHNADEKHAFRYTFIEYGKLSAN